MSTSKTRFKRQESWRLKRVKENWRRPRGVTSRMRKEKNGWPAKVKVGYGTKASGRGLHPRGLIERLVQNESDLEGLNPKTHIVRLSGQLGEKRRLVLLERVRTLNIHIANPGKEETRPIGEAQTPAGAAAGPPVSEDEAAETKVDDEPIVEDAEGLVQDPEPRKRRSGSGETEE